VPEYLRLDDDHGALDYDLSQYDGEVRYTDEEIAVFLSELETRGLLENTVIVVTSDHGESFLEHGRWNHGTGLHREEIHTPLLLVFPDARHAGTRHSSPVQTHDLYPTILDILGLPKSPELQGRSLGEAIGGAADPERPIFSEGRFRSLSLVGSVRVGAWKLIYDPKEKKAELYDVQRDPEERHDLARREPQRVRALVRQLEAFWERNAQLAPAELDEPDDLSPATVDDLRRLGYLE
jgi:arylsulfatase A-like enzyme